MTVRIMAPGCSVKLNLLGKKWQTVKSVTKSCDAYYSTWTSCVSGVKQVIQELPSCWFDLSSHVKVPLNPELNLLVSAAGCMVACCRWCETEVNYKMTKVLWIVKMNYFFKTWLRTAGQNHSESRLLFTFHWTWRDKLSSFFINSVLVQQPKHDLFQFKWIVLFLGA